MEVLSPKKGFLMRLKELSHGYALQFFFSNLWYNRYKTDCLFHLVAHKHRSIAFFKYKDIKPYGVKTTKIYTHITEVMKNKYKSPYDRLDIGKMVVYLEYKRIFYAVIKTLAATLTQTSIIKQ